MDLLVLGIAMGAGATVVLDLWNMLLKQLFGFPLPNWGMVGRWFGHLPAGQLAHADIGASPPVANERALGWVMHYAVGILFGIVTVLIGGRAWMAAPTALLPLLVGWITIGCGWFILAPGMGAGIAASKKPERMRIRILNSLGHTVFGLAMFAIALLWR